MIVLSLEVTKKFWLFFFSNKMLGFKSVLSVYKLKSPSNINVPFFACVVYLNPIWWLPALIISDVTFITSFCKLFSNSSLTTSNDFVPSSTTNSSLVDESFLLLVTSIEYTGLYILIVLH